MAEISRREAIALGAATLAVSAAPPALSAVPLPLPAWCVGTPGEMDWMTIFARTAEEAKLEWFFERYGAPPGEVCENKNCRADDCDCFGTGPDVKREPTLDQYGKPEDVPTSALFSVGWTVECSRCDYEGNYILDSLARKR